MKRSVDNYEAMLGFSLLGDLVEDPVQKANIAFLSMGGGALLELVNPTTDDSPLTRFAGTGGGLHHLCYEVDDIELALNNAREHGAVIVCPPVPAIAINNRLVAFIYTRERQLIEFLAMEIAP